MATTRTQTVDRDNWYFNDGSTSYGNGKGPSMYVGYTTVGTLTGKNRFAISIPRGTLFDGVPSAGSITAFNIKLRARGSNCDGNGGAVRFWLKRATANMGENSDTADCHVTTAGTGGVSKWPSPATDETNKAGFSGAVADNAWITVNALALGQWWYAHPEVTSLVLIAVAADAGLTADDESTTSRRAHFNTKDTTSAPYAEMTFNDNLAPTIPTSTLPADGTKQGSTNGTSATVSAVHNDPEGDTATKYQAQWFPAGTTDVTADSTTPTADNTVTANTANGATRSHTFTGLPARTAGEWRIRFYDGQWGAWSLLQTLTTAYKPTAVNLTVEPATLTPNMYASIQSNDPADYITAIEEYEYQDPAGGATITKWAPGKQSIGGSPTRSQVVYGGSPLVFGTQYRRRVVIYNRDDVPSDLTANTYFTQHATLGPTMVPGDTLTKQNTLTPTIRLSDPGSANIDQARIEWLSEDGSTVLSDSGVVSFTAAAYRDITAPAGIYAYGQYPKARGYIRVSGNADMGPSNTVTIRLNDKPGAPYPVTIEATAGSQVVQRPDGVWVTNDSTPDIRVPFRDTDKDLGYTENSVRREVEVKTMAGAAVGASPYIVTGTPSDVQTAPVLTVETQYEVRGRHDDTANVRSDWSDYAFVKYSAAPTLSAVTPANAATVTDPTPTFAWTFASSGGKAQAYYRLTASLGTTILYDTGMVAGTAASVTLAAFVLPNASTITWTLTVYDTDGLYATITRTFTTAFTQPAALTGLVLTPNDDEKAIDVLWNPSTLPANEFYAYYVYARREGGQFRLVTTITDQSASAFRLRSAAHNRETIVRVTQTNGWAESDPLEDSSMVVADGYWVASLSDINELTFVRGHGPGDHKRNLEIVEPLQRGERVVLNWGATGYEASFDIMSNDRDQLARLRAYADASEIVMFKFPYGDVRYAIVTDTPDDDGVGDWFTGNVKYIEVLPESATF